MKSLGRSAHVSRTRSKASSIGEVQLGARDPDTLFTVALACEHAG